MKNTIWWWWVCLESLKQAHQAFQGYVLLLKVTMLGSSAISSQVDIQRNHNTAWSLCSSFVCFFWGLLWGCTKDVFLVSGTLHQWLVHQESGVTPQHCPLFCQNHWGNSGCLLHLFRHSVVLLLLWQALLHLVHLLVVLEQMGMLRGYSWLLMNKSLV